MIAILQTYGREALQHCNTLYRSTITTQRGLMYIDSLNTRYKGYPECF